MSAKTVKTPKYIYLHADFPKFLWDHNTVLSQVAKVTELHGQILERMRQFDSYIKQEAMINALTEEITKSSEIEGEPLNNEEIRSLLVRSFDTNIAKDSEPGKESIVDANVDAVRNYSEPLTEERLFRWHRALFPTGRSGVNKIRTGKYRAGDLHVVSNLGFREILHYQAPPPEKLKYQMEDFISWINAEENENPMLKAAVAHLWFITLHPFDDGNRRMSRIVTEMLLCRAENTSMRYYSMSSQIKKERKDYYRILEKTMAGNLDITTWLIWFLECLGRAIESSEELLGLK
jgi:Fic family protein